MFGRRWNIARVRPSRSGKQSFQRTLTFTDRVAYQRGIEEVYWRHGSGRKIALIQSRRWIS